MTEQKSEQAVAENANHACADVRWLKCSDCGGEGDQYGDPVYNPYPNCDLCSGTGLRFPGLSQGCPHCAGTGYFEVDPTAIDCSGCDGTGLVALDTLDAWLDAVDTLGGWILTHFHARPGYKCELYPFAELPVGGATTRLEAVQQAICKAVGAHEGGEND